MLDAFQKEGVQFSILILITFAKNYKLDDIIDLIVDIMVEYGILINVIIKSENEFNKLIYVCLYI